MITRTFAIAAIIVAAVCGCNRQDPVRPSAENRGTEVGKLALPQVSYGVWGSHGAGNGLDNHFPYSINYGIVRQVARVGGINDNTGDLEKIIQTAKNAGFSFFLFEFPESWITNINGNQAWRDIITDRVVKVQAVTSSVAAYVDDVDDVRKGYTVAQFQTLQSILQSKGVQLWMSVSTTTAGNLLNYADIVTPDQYDMTLSQKRVLFQQLSASKPIQPWIRIDSGYTPRRLMQISDIRAEIALAREFSNNIWVFCDYCGYFDCVSNGKWDNFLVAAGLLQE